MLLILFTIISFFCWRAMRNSDLVMDDSFIGIIEVIIFRILKFFWVVGIIVIMLKSLS